MIEFLEHLFSGVALFDYDNDGDLDLYVTQGAMLDASVPVEKSQFSAPIVHWPGNRLFRNDLIPDGTLRFVDVTDAAGVGDLGYGNGVATGDVDNDGYTDLFVTNFGADVLYRNNGDGSFRDITAESGVGDERWTTSAAFCDLDGDGDLDLFVAAYVNLVISANKRCSASTGQRDYCAPLSFEPLPDRLYRNEGGGRFVDVSLAAGLGAAYGSGLGVTCADLDGDGRPDIYVANDGRANQLWINRGDGSFVDTALMAGTAYNADGVPEAGMGVSAGDFDNDGDADLFMTHLVNETNTLYLNDGKAHFRDATNRFGMGRISMPYTGFGTAWFDFDNDGWLDLFVANGAVKGRAAVFVTPFPFQEKNLLLRNEGGQRFKDVSARAGAALDLFEVSRGAAFGDIDNDGDLDIAVSNINGPLRLLRNDLGNRNNWLQIELRGTRGPRHGEGSRVALYHQDGRVVWRRAHTDGSYQSASDPRVLFGLGEADAIERLGVIWTSRTREQWLELEINQTHVLVEGEGAPWPDAERPREVASAR